MVVTPKEATEKVLKTIVSHEREIAMLMHVTMRQDKRIDDMLERLQKIEDFLINNFNKS